MGNRTPLSGKAWTLLIVAALVVTMAAGVAVGVLVPDNRWLPYAVGAVAVVAAMVGFKLLGGFDQLDEARKRNREK